MSGGLNHVVLMGRLTRDPEIKYTQSGKMIAEFSLAINRTYERDSDADFIGCVAWEKTAELVSKYLFKGNQVALEGSLRQDRWKTDDGKNRSKTKVTVSRIHFIASKGGEESNQEGRETTGKTSKETTDKYVEELDKRIGEDPEQVEEQKQQEEAPTPMSELDDDEIPF